MSVVILFLIRTIDPQTLNTQPNVNHNPPCVGFAFLGLLSVNDTRPDVHWLLFRLRNCVALSGLSLEKILWTHTLLLGRRVDVDQMPRP